MTVYDLPELAPEEVGAPPLIIRGIVPKVVGNSSGGAKPPPHIRRQSQGAVHGFVNLEATKTASSVNSRQGGERRNRRLSQRNSQMVDRRCRGV